MEFSTLVTVDELNRHLKDPDWAVFDVRFDLNDPPKGERQYLAGHIPGAVYAHLERDLSLPASPQGGRHPLPPVEALAQTFSRWGIESQVQVVVYDSNDGFAGRLWWILKYLGHPRVAVLDGGLSAWTGAGLPVHQGLETRPARKFQAQVQPGMLAGATDVLQAIDDQHKLIIDARAPERYQGLVEPLDPIAGHIPAAVNHFWKDNLDKDGHLLPVSTLRKEWEKVLKGHSPQDVIVYCGSGVTSCMNLLAMEHVGLEGARLYAGSWSQWSADPDLPKVLGPQERD
jgi:thiosulfate/3-mercaptopyruvate sulfurtransferase